MTSVNEQEDMKHVVVDMQTLQGDAARRGLGRYSLELVQNILEEKPSHWKLTLLFQGGTVSERGFSQQEIVAFLKENQGFNVEQWFSPGGSGSYINKNDTLFRAAEIIREQKISSLKPDVVLIPSLFEGFNDQIKITVPEKRDYVTAVVFYDTIPMIYPEEYLPSAVHKNWYEGRIKELEKADLIFSISEFSKKQLIKFVDVAPEKIHVIWGGPTSSFAEQLENTHFNPVTHFQKISAEHNIGDSYVLYNSGPDPRKNNMRAIRAFSRLPDHILQTTKLVIATALTAKERNELTQQAKNCGVVDNIITTGYLTDKDLFTLTVNATLIFYPSLTEGLGLPILEAAAAGKPIIASNSSSIPEIITNKNALFSPKNIKEMTEKLVVALTDPGIQQDLVSEAQKVAKKFSFQKSAQILTDIVDSTGGYNDKHNDPSTESVTLNFVYYGKTRNKFDNEERQLKLSRATREKRPAVTVHVISQPVTPETQKKVLESPGFVLVDISGHRPEPNLNTSQLVANYVNAEQLSRECLSLGFLTPEIIRNSEKIIFTTKEDFLTVQKLSHTPELFDFYDVFAQQGKGPHRTLRDIIQETKSDIVNWRLAAAHQIRNVWHDDFRGRKREAQRVASAITTNFPLAASNRNLFVDISELSRRDAKTGIQRVVKKITRALLEVPPAGYKVQPVRYVENQGFCYAQKFVNNSYGFEQPYVEPPIDWTSGDIFLGLDLQIDDVVANKEQLAQMSQDGVHLAFVVYDLLPVSHPKFFPEGVNERFMAWLETIREADQLLCISEDVATKVGDYYRSSIGDSLAGHRSGAGNVPQISSFLLGADIVSTPKKSKATMPPEDEVLGEVAINEPFVLMVGTLEPRKRHRDVLAAFDHMWKTADGSTNELSLVIVGKPGWQTDLLQQQLLEHPQLDKKLFWLKNTNDTQLNALYEQAQGVIVASECEGFGLPLIEAAQHGTPILARDIPVFREIAGVNATYFNETSPRLFAVKISEWIQAIQSGVAPDPSLINITTWEQSTGSLTSKLPLVKRNELAEQLSGGKPPESPALNETEVVTLMSETV